MERRMSQRPIAVVGGSNCDNRSDAYKAAEELGRKLAGKHYPIVCGGRFGVMEAVCKGCQEAGGISIGILPRPDEKANKFCTIILATDLGNATKPISKDYVLRNGKDRISRNRVIVRGARAVFVVNGTPDGTGDEVQFAYEFGIPAFGLCNPAAPREYPDIWSGNYPGFKLFDTPDNALRDFYSMMSK
jgi:uncharacterized protein (TIGR00725 family)